MRHSAEDNRIYRAFGLDLGEITHLLMLTNGLVNWIRFIVSDVNYKSVMRVVTIVWRQWMKLPSLYSYHELYILSLIIDLYKN